MNLIISADDFGKSEVANKNILRLTKLDKVQRVSIFVNGSFNKNEIKQLLDSKIKLDIHLDPRLRGDDRGDVLFRTIHFVFLYLAGNISKKKIETDWRNLIIKFRKIFGKYPDG